MESDQYEYYPEKTLIGFNVPINADDLNIIKKKLKTVCAISIGNIKATGFFCKINIYAKTKNVLFTNNHVLDENLIQIGQKINILYNESNKEIEITKNRFICTNSELDYTCIEILTEDNIHDFLQVDREIHTFNPFKTYQNDKIVIIQYPHSDTPEFEFGKIKKYSKKTNLIYYSIPTLSGSSGSPVLSFNRNLNVIAIHCGSPKDEKLKSTLNVGIFFESILDDIEKQYKLKH